ncbi:hypothetical protein MRB53_009635 [Persea americana]|uniref:Uncharacterized protein n=1 Tax=Persea americana TaxID=3435 RepID=A0ACC2LQC5_PERAE|nr:hypothetical protein MRB53_009635 [Persea americana]
MQCRPIPYQRSLSSLLLSVFLAHNSQMQPPHQSPSSAPIILHPRLRNRSSPTRCSHHPLSIHPIFGCFHCWPPHLPPLIHPISTPSGFLGFSSCVFPAAGRDGVEGEVVTRVRSSIEVMIENRNDEENEEYDEPDVDYDMDLDVDQDL